MGDFLSKVLPWIGAAASGNVPALIGLAAKQVSDIIGVDVAPEADAIAKAVAGASPDQIVKLREADAEFKLKAQAMGFTHAEEMAKIGLQKDTLTIDDVKDARLRNAANPDVFRLAYVILITFAAVMVAVLYGCYSLIVGTIVFDANKVAVIAAIAGLVGAVVGYVAANAQTVINFIYGGSLGSEKKTDALAGSVQQAIAGVMPPITK